jgi:hypothetical protein
MKRNSEMIDGISVATWKEIQKISKQYPKPIRYAEGTQAKLFILKFYMEPLMKDERPPMQMMEPGRMITIAYRIYKESNGDNVRDLALTLLKKYIS